MKPTRATFAFAAATLTACAGLIGLDEPERAPDGGPVDGSSEDAPMTDRGETGTTPPDAEVDFDAGAEAGLLISFRDGGAALVLPTVHVYSMVALGTGGGLAYVAEKQGSDITFVDGDGNTVSVMRDAGGANTTAQKLVFYNHRLAVGGSLGAGAAWAKLLDAGNSDTAALEPFGSFVDLAAADGVGLVAVVDLNTKTVTVDDSDTSNSQTLTGSNSAAALDIEGLGPLYAVYYQAAAGLFAKDMVQVYRSSRTALTPVGGPLPMLNASTSGRLAFGSASTLFLFKTDPSGLYTGAITIGDASTALSPTQGALPFSNVTVRTTATADAGRIYVAGCTDLPWISRLTAPADGGFPVPDKSFGVAGSVELPAFTPDAGSCVEQLTLADDGYLMLLVNTPASTGGTTSAFVKIPQ